MRKIISRSDSDEIIPLDIGNICPECRNKTQYYSNISSNDIQGLIICSLISLILFSIHGYWLEINNKFVQFVLINIRLTKARLYIDAIVGIYDYWFFGVFLISGINKQNQNQNFIVVQLSHQYELFYNLIKMNPNISVSKKIAKKLGKKYGESFYNSLLIAQ